MTPPDERRLRWHYGPTNDDPDPGRMWCYDDGGEVYAMDDGYVCTRCDRQDEL